MVAMFRMCDAVTAIRIWRLSEEILRRGQDVKDVKAEVLRNERVRFVGQLFSVSSRGAKSEQAFEACLRVVLTIQIIGGPMYR